MVLVEISLGTFFTVRTPGVCKNPSAPKIVVFRPGMGTGHSLDHILKSAAFEVQEAVGVSSYPHACRRRSRTFKDCQEGVGKGGCWVFSATSSSLSVYAADCPGGHFWPCSFLSLDVLIALLYSQLVSFSVSCGFSVSDRKPGLLQASAANEWQGLCFCQYTDRSQESWHLSLSCSQLLSSFSQLFFNTKALICLLLDLELFQRTEGFRRLIFGLSKFLEGTDDGI